VLTEERLIKIRDAVNEFADNLEESGERVPGKSEGSLDPETSSAVESVGREAAPEAIPVLQPEELPLEWQGVSPVLCIAARSFIDEAAAIMLGQLTAAHGLRARIEGPEALSTTNLFRLETAGISIVCLVYMDASAPAHMRYSVRRLRRKFPKAIIILTSCAKDTDADTLEGLRENAKADLAAANLGEATRLCIETVRRTDLDVRAEAESSSAITAVLGALPPARRHLSHRLEEAVHLHCS
jgi:hypothetical protein